MFSDGSTLSAMSQAIEKAKVVLILLSEGYKDSPACRAGRNQEA